MHYWRMLRNILRRERGRFRSPQNSKAGTEVSVSDQGAGIDDMEQALISTSFTGARTNATGCRAQEWDSAIARAIIEAHGGRIGVTSQLHRLGVLFLSAKKPNQVMAGIKPCTFVAVYLIGAHSFERPVQILCKRQWCGGDLPQNPRPVRSPWLRERRGYPPKRALDVPGTMRC